MLSVLSGSLCTGTSMIYPNLHLHPNLSKVFNRPTQIP